MDTKPNTVLPDGGKLIPVLRKKVGNWVEMEFDAEVMRFGQRWLRVKDGMGGRNDREDWIMDIPGQGVSIHDYHWNGEDFGANHGSFDNAILEEMKLSRGYASEKRAELLGKLRDMERSIELLDAAISEAR